MDTWHTDVEKVQLRNKTYTEYIANIVDGFRLIKLALPNALFATHTIPTIAWTEVLILFFPDGSIILPLKQACMQNVI